MSIDFSCNYDENPDRMLSAVDKGAVTFVIVPSSQMINTLKSSKYVLSFKNSKWELAFYNISTRKAQRWQEKQQRNKSFS